MFCTYLTSFNLPKGDNYAASNYPPREKFMRTQVVETRKQYPSHQLLGPTGQEWLEKGQEPPSRPVKAHRGEPILELLTGT